MADSNNMSDLWKRLRFVLIGIIVYRIGTHIPIPGIDPQRLSSLFDQNHDFDQIKMKAFEDRYQV